MNIKKNLVKTIAYFVIIFLSGLSLYSHCQIPCGIYNDQMRIDMIREHIATIEKSMKQIRELSSADHKNFNQIVRWVTNKDKHADDISSIVSYYFLAQRIKPVETDKAYSSKLKSLHRLIVLSMKAKQSLDNKVILGLKKELKNFSSLYFTEHKH